MANDPDSATEVHTVDETAEMVTDGSFNLPAFQRDEVWDASRKILLWHSLLQGIPIGIILISEARKDLQTNARELSQQGTPENPTWLILDGQQRCRTLKLANPPSPGVQTPSSQARLWVDLLPKKSEHNILGCRFYLCQEGVTPWGISLAGRPTETNRRTARQSMFKNSPELLLETLHQRARKALSAGNEDNSSDEQFKQRLEHHPDPWLTLEELWPIQANYPVPFDCIVAQIRDGQSPDLDSLTINGTTNREELGSAEEAEARKHLEAMTEQLKSTLSSPVFFLKAAQPNRASIAGEQGSPTLVEWLGKVFERINAQGVPLTGADLFFSAIKVQWPDAGHLVNEICEDPLTGRILSPIEIIHLAVRLERTSPSHDRPHGDVPRLEKDTLSRLQDFKPETDLAPYLNGDSQPEGLFSLRTLLGSLRQAIQFHPDQNKSGLPLPLLARLDWRVWHTMAAWAQGKSSSQIREQKQNLIRFALLFHFHAYGNSERFTRRPFETALRNRDDAFPGHDILTDLKKEGYLICSMLIGDEQLQNGKGVLTPDQYEDALSVNLRKSSPWNMMYNEVDLVFWSQRYWIHRWFHGIYDPVAHQRRDDQPFDIDHIIPRSWFDGRGILLEKKAYGKNLEPLQNHGKDLAGNFRIWPKSLNRSDSATSPAQKIDTPDISEEAKHWGFNTPSDIRIASAISETEMQSLKESEPASGNEKKWNETRIQATRGFIQERQSRLYSELYRELRLDEWVQSPSLGTEFPS